MNNITEVPECFYRISVKALVLNETRDKFLVIQDITGGREPEWDLPGGGLEYGINIKEELQRELMEETGLTANWIADHPAYFITGPMQRAKPNWSAGVLYEATLEHLNFTPTNECQAIDWLGHDNRNDFPLGSNSQDLLNQFDPARHQK